MILLSQKSDTFNLSSMELSSYVTNMENYIDWFPGVISISSKNDSPHGVVGKQYSEQLQFPEGKVGLTIEVQHAVHGKSFVTEGDLEPLLPRMEMSFAGQGKNSCLFTLMYFSRNGGLAGDETLLQTLKADLADRSNRGFAKLHEKIGSNQLS